MIETILINTLSIGSITSGYLIERTEGFDFPEIDIDITSRGNWHGARLGKYRYDRRIMSIELLILGNTASDYETKRRALQQALRIHNGLSTVVFTTRSGVVVQADCIANSKFTAPYKKGDVIMGTARIELVAPYPFLEGRTENSESLSVFEGGGWAIPFGLPLDMSEGQSGGNVLDITNNGNGLAFPTIRIYGEIENPSLQNVTTGELISLVYTLASENDFIELDMFERTATLNGVGGTNLRQYVSGDWWALVQGLNQIKLTAGSYSGGAHALVNYRDGYLGL